MTAAKDRRTKAELVAEYEARIGKLLEKQSSLLEELREDETWMEAHDAKAERLSRCLDKLQSMTFRRNAWRGLAIGLGVLPVLMTLREMGVLP